MTNESISNTSQATTLGVKALANKANIYGAEDECRAVTNAFSAAVNEYVENTPIYQKMDDNGKREQKRALLDLIAKTEDPFTNDSVSIKKIVNLAMKKAGIPSSAKAELNDVFKGFKLSLKPEMAVDTQRRKEREEEERRMMEANQKLENIESSSREPSINT